MTPVISPWVFYLMPICENVGTIFLVTGVFLTTLAIVLFFLAVAEEGSPYGDEDVVIKYKALTKKVGLAAIIFLLVCCFIPSEKTITKMIIAQNVTYERLEVVGDTVGTIYNDIMELFDEETGDG